MRFADGHGEDDCAHPDESDPCSRLRAERSRPADGHDDECDRKADGEIVEAGHRPEPGGEVTVPRVLTRRGHRRFPRQRHRCRGGDQRGDQNDPLSAAMQPWSDLGRTHAESRCHEEEPDGHRDGPRRADRPEDPLLVEDLGEGEVLDEVAPVTGQACLSKQPDGDDADVVRGKDPNRTLGQEVDGGEPFIRIDDRPCDRLEGAVCSHHEEPWESCIERFEESGPESARVQDVPNGAELVHVEDHDGHDGERPLTLQGLVQALVKLLWSGDGPAWSDDRSPGDRG